MKNKFSINPKYIAELLGTFVLSLFVGVSLIGSLPTPFVAGFALLLCVYALGHISGAHVNPAITLGLWSIRKISSKQASYYIAAQVVGALIALLFLRFVSSDFKGVMPEVSDIGFAKVFVAEMLGAFFFAFGVAIVSFKKEHTAWNGVIVGGSLFLGILVANTFGSFGVLNPSVAIVVFQKYFHFAYLLAPIIGSIGAMQLYKFLISKNNER